MKLIFETHWSRNRLPVASFEPLLDFPQNERIHTLSKSKSDLVVARREFFAAVIELEESIRGGDFNDLGGHVKGRSTSSFLEKSIISTQDKKGGVRIVTSSRISLGTFARAVRLRSLWMSLILKRV